MGWMFNIEHANLVNYLTTDEPRDIMKIDAPTTERGILKSFFQGLKCQYGGDEELSVLLSANSDWRTEIRTVAKDLEASLSKLKTDPIKSTDVAKLLAPLRSHFTGYKLYTLILTNNYLKNSPEYIFFRQASLATEGNALILMPKGERDFL